MDERVYVRKAVDEFKASGVWVDCGRWFRAKNGTLQYRPTKREIATKRRLLRSRPHRQGAHKRKPRGGEFAVMTTKGI
jgi:hypothetical protein